MSGCNIPSLSILNMTDTHEIVHDLMADIHLSSEEAAEEKVYE